MSKEFDYPRDFKGIWLPKEIWLDDDLNSTDKIIFAEIDSLDVDGSEGCYASNEYLAGFCKCSITKVSTSISRLIELGYVKVVKTDGRKRWLKASLSKFESQTNENKKSEIQEMKESNITSNKNDKNIDKNSVNNSSKDMKRLSLEDTHNSPVSEETKQETHVSKTLGRKTHATKQASLKDMPTRAREIAERLVDDTETVDKVSDCICYFLEQYKAHRHKEHIHLTNDKLHDVVATMLSTITIQHENDSGIFESDYNPIVADNVDIEDIKWVIDEYFQTQFREKTDYSLVHFTQDGVLTNVMNKCTLGGNPWYESHSL